MRAGAPIHGVFLEESQALAAKALLAGVQQRQPGQGGGQDRHGLSRLGCSVQLFIGAVPAVDVVVGDEVHPNGAHGVAFHAVNPPFQKGLAIRLPLGDLLQDLLQPPVVGGVKARTVHLGLVGLGQHEQGAVLLQDLACHFPKAQRQVGRHVTAKAVQAHFSAPKAHGLEHGHPQLMHLKVQLRHVFPILGVLGVVGVGLDRQNVPHLVSAVPVGVLGDPGMVEGGVVGHPIQDHLQAQRMRPRDQFFQVLQRAELGVDRGVVAYGVVAAQAALAARLADGL